MSGLLDRLTDAITAATYRPLTDAECAALADTIAWDVDWGDSWDYEWLFTDPNALLPGAATLDYIRLSWSMLKGKP